MSNKPHLRPHQKKHASRITRLLVGILIVAVFALVIALEATGHIIFRGRLNPVMRSDKSPGRCQGGAGSCRSMEERTRGIGWRRRADRVGAAL